MIGARRFAVAVPSSPTHRNARHSVPGPRTASGAEVDHLKILGVGGKLVVLRRGNLPGAATKHNSGSAQALKID